MILRLVSLRGKVLSIGGLKEKSMAAFVFLFLFIFLFSLPVNAVEVNAIPSDEVLSSVREASRDFKFCYKSDDDIYALFRDYYPDLSVDNYSRFFVSIPTSTFVVYFIPDDCAFSGTSSVLRFSSNCLKLTYSFINQQWVRSTIFPTTYFSSGNSFFVISMCLLMVIFYCRKIWTIFMR